MKTTASRRAAREVVYALAAACSLALGCGGSGGGGARPSADDAGADGAEVNAVCSEFAAHSAGCPAISRCAQAEATYCSTWLPSFSAAFQAGLEECLSSTQGCSDAGLLASSEGCVAAHLTAPTPAQAKVKADFCAQCPDGRSAAVPASCSQFFNLAVNDAGQSTNVGSPVLGVSDGLAAIMDMQCTGAAAIDAGVADCATAFRSCVSSVVLFDANLPAPCTDVTQL
jgi:hypothetical protein